MSGVRDNDRLGVLRSNIRSVDGSPYAHFQGQVAAPIRYTRRGKREVRRVEAVLRSDSLLAVEKALRRVDYGAIIVEIGLLPDAADVARGLLDRSRIARLFKLSMVVAVPDEDETRATRALVKTKCCSDLHAAEFAVR